MLINLLLLLLLLCKTLVWKGDREGLQGEGGAGGGQECLAYKIGGPEEEDL
jgi:hypothetical protein